MLAEQPQAGFQQFDLVVIDTCNVPSDQLWDAHAIATYLGLPDWTVVKRISLRQTNQATENTSNFSARRGQVMIPVHLSKLRVPQAFINMISSANKSLVRATIINEVDTRHRSHDRVRCEQTLHALCSARSIDVTVEG
jgi:hypothetical protein